MKLVTGKTMQAIDQTTISRFGIPGTRLMEAAGKSVFRYIQETFSDCKFRSVVLVAGKGNNGGDGYVIARHLLEHGWKPQVFLLAGKDEITGDAAHNLSLLPPSILRECPTSDDFARHVAEMGDADLLVDALFGTGLTSEVTGRYAEAIDWMNRSGVPVLSVDIPSGIDSASGHVLGKAVHAETTITFGLAKVGHCTGDGPDHVGRVIVEDIGFPAELLAAAEGVEYITAEEAGRICLPRARTSHKGSNGHVLAIAGSTGKTGAAALVANSAVRAGAGLVTTAIPAGLNAIMEVKTTEAMTVPVGPSGSGAFSESDAEQLLKAAAGKSVVALGPGIGWTPETEALLTILLPRLALPLLLDADGLNCLGKKPSLLRALSSPAVILTPHPGEMARLAACSVAEVETDRCQTAGHFAREYGVYLLLKGAGTVIAAPDGRIAVNGSGNAGMATGGMGDLLTGVIAALIAQGYEPFAACCLGAYIHGLAGDLVAEEKGQVGLTAGDLLEKLPYAFKLIAKRQIPNGGRDANSC